MDQHQNLNLLEDCFAYLSYKNGGVYAYKVWEVNCKYLILKECCINVPSKQHLKQNNFLINNSNNEKKFCLQNVSPSKAQNLCALWRCTEAYYEKEMRRAHGSIIPGSVAKRKTGLPYIKPHSSSPSSQLLYSMALQKSQTEPLNRCLGNFRWRRKS